MTDAAEPQQEASRKASKLPLILGLALAAAGGGGSFYAVTSGLLPLAAEDTDSHGTEDAAGPEHLAGRPDHDVAFVELPQILVSLGESSSNTHLRFRAALEVPDAQASAVRKLEPRILDAMNGYLRALEASDIEARDALIQIRAQLTRRIQLVVGSERMRDLLVLEFVLN